MNRQIHASFSVAIVLILLTGSASLAFLASRVDLARDAVVSDAICVGRTIERHTIPCEKDGTYEIVITLQVDRTLKGDVPVGSVLTIRYTSKDTYERHFLTGYDMVLVNKQDSEYTFARPYLSSMPVSSQARSAYVQSADSRANLRWEVLNSLQDASPVVVREALNQPALFSPGEFVTYVKPRTSDADKGIRALAFAACVSAGDKSSVLPALSFVLQRLEEGIAVSDASSLAYLRVVLERADIPSDALSLLSINLNSKSDHVREFASLMLRVSHNAAALPYLKAALTDSNVKVRYNAVMGLAETTRDYQHGPAFNVYQRDEQSYLDYWSSRSVP